MAFWRGVKRRLKSLLFPALFVAGSGFFIWHTLHGERGTLARERRVVEIAQARDQLRTAQTEQAALSRRVSGLRADALDRDQLEERARALLNLTHPGETVIPYGPQQRLY